MKQLMISAKPFTPNIMARPAMYALLAATIFGAPSAFAEVPLTFNYQGKAFTPTGAPLSGNQTMWFKIIHKTTPTDVGIVVYAETAEVVLSPDGVVNHAVGTGTPAAGQSLETADFNAPTGTTIHLSVAGGIEENVLLPHTPIQAVPMAVIAKTLGGEKFALGTNNQATGAYSASLGGNQNIASGNFSFVPGGSYNNATGNHSLPAGFRASSPNANGCFVWSSWISDNQDYYQPPPIAGSFNVKAPGGIRFGTVTDENGNVTQGLEIFNNGQVAVQGNGKLSASLIEVRGADVAEGFDQTDGSAAEPGTVMVIDEANPGDVKPSAIAYDRKVAGVISGAGGVRPGLKLTQEGVADGNNLIAMAGRVYAKASAENGVITPGDLLTTSNTAGHAMRADDTGPERGVILGKAMTELKEGTGLVLVLVNLQ